MAALEPPPDLERRCRRRAGRCARRTTAKVARPDGTSTLAVAAVGSRGGVGHSHRARLFSGAGSLRPVSLPAGRHQVHRGARYARRHALDLSRALPLADAVLLSPDHYRGAIGGAGPARPRWHVSLASKRDSRACLRLASATSSNDAPDPARRPYCRAVIPYLSAPRRTALGLADRSRRALGIIRHYATRLDQRAVTLRCGCLSG